MPKYKIDYTGIQIPGSTIGSELLGRRFIFRDWVSDYPLLSYGSRKR